MRRIFILIFIACLYMSSNLFADNSKHKHRHVLILHSYHSAFPWTQSLHKALISKLDEYHEKLHVSVEYMDTKNYKLETIESSLIELYSLKYANQKPDVLILSDNYALSFALANRTTLFKGVPIIFSGINNFSQEMLGGEKNITGVSEGVDMGGCLSLIDKVHPDATELVAVADNTITGQMNLENFKTKIKQFESRFKIRKLIGLTDEEIVPILKGLSSSSVVFYLSFFQDRFGNVRSMQDNIAILAENSPVPIYVLWDWAIPFGATGGVVTSGRMQGVRAGEMALKILSGQPADNISILEKSPTEVLFNYPKAIQYSLAFELLPENTVFYESPTSFYYRHTTLVHIVIIGIVFLLGGIITLFVMIKRERTISFTLDHQKRLLNDILMNIPHYIFWKNKNSVYQGANDSFAQLVGLSSPSEIVGKSDDELTDNEEDRKFYRMCDNQVIETGVPMLNIEEPYHGSDGKAVTVMISKVPLTDSKGNVTGVLGVAFDITERKKNEKALLESEEKFRVIFEYSNDGIVLGDAVTKKLMMVNNKACEMLGYTQDEITQLFVKDIHPQESLEMVIDAFEKQLRNEIRISENLPVKRKDGTVFYADINSTPITIDGQKYLVGNFRDITNRKQAEQELLGAKQKFQSMVENIGLGVVLISKDMRVIELNKQMREWFPRYIKDSKPICYKAFHDPPRDTVCDWCPINKTLQDGAVHESTTAIPISGEIRKFRIVSSPIFNSKGEIDAAIEMVEDVTEKMKFEEQRRQAQRMDSIGNLAGGIAHDFNNILFPIIGMSELLLEDLPPGSPERENVEEIFRAGNRGADLVKQILAFSRQTEHKIIPTRVQNILKEVLKLTRSTIPAYIEIKQDIQPDCGMVKADPTQIHQIAMNIITNSFHALEDKGGQITVQLKQVELTGMNSSEISLDPGLYALLSVSDTGHGMPSELVDKIFEPYFTTKEQGKGTGLGLAVVYGIVQEHKGNIRVHSKVGKGTTTNVYLPLMDRPEKALSIEQVKIYKGGNESILFVDDEVPIAKLGEQMLNRLGYHVTIRVNALEALEAFKAKPDAFDLVISDMAMPQKTGAQLAKDLTSIRPDIPIIICTGFSERLNLEKVAAIGVNEILMKPIVKAELAKTVRKVLDNEVRRPPNSPYKKA